ncbi:hypothetical protein CRE_30462 [Caenorhabditis remanei]|uniref:RING-type domain-containing protein n=1 Tax=Caenorhabditis remanei TaxID=31234 RepID=E3NDX8_CAERE|nr:hypothetical protein CRE_30462 [Caenorhabditis remanei]
MSFPKCGICSFEYSDETGHRVPRTLKCSHTVCSSCAGKLVENCAIECPLCRGITSDIVNNDVGTLQKNFGLLDFMRNLKVESDVVYVNSPPQCKTHSYNLAEFVCIKSDCTAEDKLMCRTCEEFGKHKGHQKGLLVEEGMKIRKKVGELINETKSQKELIETHLEKIKSVQDSYASNGDNYKMVVNGVNLHFESIRRIVDEAEEKVLQALRDKSESATDKVDQLVSNDEFDIVVLNEYIEKMNQLLLNPDSELIGKNPSLQRTNFNLRIIEPPKPLTENDVLLPTITLNETGSGQQ